MNAQLINRIKSFLWRGGSMAAMAFLVYASDNIGLLELSPAIQSFLTILLGLASGEVTKYLNS
jgi:hypothetical protein